MFEPKDFEPENNGAEQEKSIYVNKTCLDPEIKIPCFLELPFTPTTCESFIRNITGAGDSVIFD